MNQIANILVRIRNSFFAGVKRGGLVVFITMMFIALSTATFAQVQQVERQAPPMEQLPQEQNQLVISYDDEIKKDELPEAVVSSVNENYPSYEIAEIYRGSDGSYKVKLEHGEKKIAAFYDAGGEFLRVANDEQEETINDDWR